MREVLGFIVTMTVVILITNPWLIRDVVLSLRKHSFLFFLRRKCSGCYRHADWFWSKDWQWWPTLDGHRFSFLKRYCPICGQQRRERFFSEVRNFVRPSTEQLLKIETALQLLQDPQNAPQADRTLKSLINVSGPFLPRQLLDRVHALRDGEYRQAVSHGYRDDYDGAPWVTTGVTYQRFFPDCHRAAGTALEYKRILASRWGGHHLPAEAATARC